MAEDEQHAAATPAPASNYTILSATAACWALLFSMALSMLSNGLQGTLVSLRATYEGFGTDITGLVMSGYFAGFAAGSLLAPRLVGRVGHVRVFAALASIASVSPLIHSILVEPATWFAMRLLTGFSYAGIYVVAESWLNERATNRTRGMLLSIYMIVILAAMAAGPLLLNLSHPMSSDLFILGSVLVSLAVVPILLAAAPVPSYETPDKLGIAKLFRLAPLGMVGVAVTGMSNGALVSMGAVYADSIGFSVAQVSLFVSLALLGNVFLQWPVGWLSDRFDRRKILTAVTFGAALVALAGLFAGYMSIPMVMVLVCLFGGLSFSMYSLCLAHTNDRLDPRQMVAASSTLVLAGGAGATLGPYGASLIMDSAGAEGFFWFFAAVHAALGAYALYRMARRAATPAEEQESTALGIQPGTVSPAFSAETYQEWIDSADGTDEEPIEQDSDAETEPDAGSAKPAPEPR